MAPTGASITAEQKNRAGLFRPFLHSKLILRSYLSLWLCASVLQGFILAGLISARRWNDSIHAQILGHLPVVIESVPGKHGAHS
jgi:hypothetical protein